jgi:antagonist of KipI
MTATVLAAGLQTSIQGMGRFGHRHLGVGTAGALDGYSARVGNWLVGNDANSALLEITLQGPRLRFERAVRIAITGADIDAHIGETAIPGWRPIDLPTGCELTLGACRRGARAYLAIAGGVQAPNVLGSASTDLRAGFGGLAGRCLIAGDSLQLGPATETKVSGAVIANWWLDPQPDLDFKQPALIRVLSGHDAAEPAMQFYADSYHVSAQSNRQGLRLQGAALRIADARERVSEPVAPGTVQLPPDGQPIVLLAEAQTIGGYPRIGHVAGADLPRLAQLRPGDNLRFQMIDAAAAQTLACAQRQRLARIALAIEQRQRDG